MSTFTVPLRQKKKKKKPYRKYINVHTKGVFGQLDTSSSWSARLRRRRLRIILQQVGKLSFDNGLVVRTNERVKPIRRENFSSHNSLEYFRGGFLFLLLLLFSRAPRHQTLPPRRQCYDDKNSTDKTRGKQQKRKPTSFSHPFVAPHPLSSGPGVNCRKWVKCLTHGSQQHRWKRFAVVVMYVVHNTHGKRVNIYIRKKMKINK